MSRRYGEAWRASPDVPFTSSPGALGVTKFILHRPHSPGWSPMDNHCAEGRSARERRLAMRVLAERIRNRLKRFRFSAALRRYDAGAFAMVSRVTAEVLGSGGTD
jgi:hypothetical protein